MKQRGNVLFLILIAVALFAALSYAVTSSTRSGNNNSSTEAASAQAAAIINSFEAVDFAVTRMRMAGIPIENIDLGYQYKRYDGTITPTSNSNCTTNNCRVFNPAGGGVSPPTFETYGVESPTGWTGATIQPGYFDVNTLKWTEIGTTSDDVIMRYSGIKPQLCTELNKKLGITNIPLITGNPAGNAFQSYNWDNGTAICSNNCDFLTSTKTFTGFSGNYCVIYHLVIVR